MKSEAVKHLLRVEITQEASFCISQPLTEFGVGFAYLRPELLDKFAWKIVE